MHFVYDLHSHTTASDGTLSPSALVEYAARCGVEVLAVTDHDATAGLTEATGAAQTNNIVLVSGIEISVTWAHQTIHVVGLLIDPECGVLQRGLTGQREFRVWRAQEIARRLEKARIPDSLAGAKAFAGGDIISRTHFAQFLVAQGYAKDMKQVFKRYLVRNKPGYVPGQWANLDAALDWIHRAGGLAVLAHPARYKISSQRLQQLLAEFRDRGGAGIEVVSGSHSRDDMLRFAQLAQHFGFYASRGSDYHGPENAYADPAKLPSLPENCRPIWEHPQWLSTCIN